jgi:hypothetical protein
MVITYTIKYICNKVIILVVAIITNTIFFSSPVFAQTDAAIIAELRAQIDSLSSRLEQLESENSVTQTVASTNSQNSSDHWVNNIEISGDLRSRYENIDDANAAKDRNQNRIRARLDISAEVNDDWNMSFGLASGGDDPISTNQTLGGGSTSKGLVLDFAYFVYNGINNLSITGGKHKNVFYRAGGNAMLWDGDYRPEGVALKYSVSNLFVNAGTMILESDDKAGAQDKESMWGVQTGFRLGDLTIGASYFEASVKGSMAFYDASLFGNSSDASGAFLYDFEEAELFAEYYFSLGELELSLFGDFVQNQDANTEDTGWVLGTTFGTVPWELGYSFQDLEADAVFGTFTDSDYGGGGTGAEGHIFTGEYSIAPSTSVGFTYFVNERGITDTDYDRLQVDLSVSF